MGFNIDLQELSLDVFKQIIIESNLVPSRIMLKEYADDYFDLLANHNIPNIEELVKKLKNKKGISDLSESTGVPEEYLTILVREIKGYIRKPIKLKEFPGLKAKTITKLEEVRIVNSHQLFSEVLTPKSREALASKTGINLDELLKATKMIDLSRIRWVNHTFAFVLHEAGFDSAEKVATADPIELYEKVKTLNEERKFFPAHIGLKDMKRCVEAAQLVPFDVDY